MLQSLRQSLQGTIAKVIMALIIVPFALVGVESLLTGGGVQYVAEVNDDKISAVDLQLEVNQQKRRLLMTMGENLDPSLLDDQLLAGPSLDFLIQKSLLTQAAADYGMAISDQALADFISDMDVFKVNERFDEAMFRRVISEQGYSPAGFQQALRQDMIMTQLRAGIAGSTFATPAEIEQLAAFAEERRDLRYMVLPIGKFRSDAEIDDAAIVARYEEGEADYMTEESVVLSYIELTPEDFAAQIEVADADMRELYEAELELWRQPEQRRVAHILLTTEDGESAETYDARIADVSARLFAGEDFAELAEALSDDIGSASQGGELGFTDGSLFPAPMEDAIAELGLGQISDPVQTDAGTHFITLLELRDGKVREYEEVRGELEQRLRQERAQRDLIKTVERLRDLAFNAEDLSGPAQELDITVEISEPVTRTQAEGLFANAALRTAAFSTEVLGEGFNSEVVELAAEHFVVLRVKEHRLPERRALEEVRNQIVAQLRDEAARERIRETADRLLSRLRAGESIEALALENEYLWQVELASARNNPAAPEALLQRAFRLPSPAQGQTVFDYVQNSEGDIEVLELVRVLPPEDLAGARRQLLERQLINEHGQQTDSYFQQQLRDSADITRS
ncbi:MAG: SurA N-terminal domain-containing protein [Pseudomonadota bacterium]